MVQKGLLALALLAALAFLPRLVRRLRRRDAPLPLGEVKGRIEAGALTVFDVRPVPDFSGPDGYIASHSPSRMRHGNAPA